MDVIKATFTGCTKGLLHFCNLENNESFDANPAKVIGSSILVPYESYYVKCLPGSNFVVQGRVRMGY